MKNEPLKGTCSVFLKTLGYSLIDFWHYFVHYYSLSYLFQKSLHLGKTIEPPSGSGGSIREYTVTLPILVPFSKFKKWDTVNPHLSGTFGTLEISSG